MQPDRATVVNFRPGDVVVLECPGVLPRAVIDDLRANWKKHTGTTVVVLERGLRIAGVRSKHGRRIGRLMAG